MDRIKTAIGLITDEVIEQNKIARSLLFNIAKRDKAADKATTLTRLAEAIAIESSLTLCPKCMEPVENLKNGVCGRCYQDIKDRVENSLIDISLGK